MAWETRRGRGRYYTRSTRRGGRVERHYIGVGPAAEAAAAGDELRRAERCESREAARAEEARAAGLTRPLEELSAALDLLTAATLAGLGFHRHDRGVWRRKRNASDDTGER